MEKMPQLFNLNLEDPDEVKATKFISKLQELDFVGINMVYLSNYIDADLSIALGHIRDGYKRYVLKGNWSEEKYQDIVYVIARNRQMLIPSVFLSYGIKYDEGKLKREIQLERQKYKVEKETNEDEVSDEEKELLEYIFKNGGGR